MATTRPNCVQYVAYAYGFRRLPDSIEIGLPMTSPVRDPPAFHDRVRRTPAHSARTVLAASRVAVCARGDDVPIYIWALLISLAMNKVWRRHRLAQHGLDPNLVDVIRRQKEAKDHELRPTLAGRPQSAEWQANSNPFF